jgi:hypothetical protein
LAFGFGSPFWSPFWSTVGSPFWSTVGSPFWSTVGSPLRSPLRNPIALRPVTPGTATGIALGGACGFGPVANRSLALTIELALTLQFRTALGSRLWTALRGAVGLRTVIGTTRWGPLGLRAIAVWLRTVIGTTRWGPLGLRAIAVWLRTVPVGALGLRTVPVGALGLGTVPVGALGLGTALLTAFGPGIRHLIPPGWWAGHPLPPGGGCGGTGAVTTPVAAIDRPGTPAVDQLGGVLHSLPTARASVARICRTRAVVVQGLSGEQLVVELFV